MLTPVGHEKLTSLREGDTIVYLAGQDEHRIEATGQVIQEPGAGATGVHIRICMIWSKGEKSEATLGQEVLAGAGEVYRGREEREWTWRLLVTSAFEAAELPEVHESQLEAGTHTNAWIAERLRGDPAKLLGLLMKVSNLPDDPVVKRSILSFAVDLI